MIVQQEKATQY